ncbi:Crp/Fnr family transcriptional regulator [Paraliobacillus sediminis]|uniref:Crp/Fnr family transcriptional regulator n=1 Tax=Paraliobacillus sediminis TaxID=1885916 RepID=UPI000E3CE672|nr:Crp/Fnr family transcriptional regulator [Paraliobacillus sediminis]
MQIPTNTKSCDLISPELRNLLLSIGTKKKIYKNDFLFREGKEANEIYLLQSGIVQISKLTYGGKQLLFRVCKKHDIVGALTSFAGDPRFLLSCNVFTDGEVIGIKKDLLEKELLSNSTLTLEFIRWESAHMRKFQSKFRDLLLNGKKGALYSTLIRFSNSYGIETNNEILINLVITNQELGDFCATTKESVNRMLNELRQKNVISIDANAKITIHDIAFLRETIGCEYCPIEI